MCAASQLLMWMMALHLHVNQKSDYDDMIPKASKLSIIITIIKTSIYKYNGSTLQGVWKSWVCCYLLT